MTQEVNNNYMRQLERRQKTPVYILELEGVTTRYSDQLVRGQLGTTKRYLMSVNGAGAQLRIIDGRASIGNVTFSLLDKNDEITKLEFQYTLQNRKITIKGGFDDLQESDYITVFTGRILNYTLQSDNLTWRFEATNLWHSAKENVFTAITRLNGAINNSQATITVYDTGPFATATASKYYIKIDDEVISYTGVTATTFTGCSRGQLGTTPAAHSNDAEVPNFIALSDNPVDIALQILTSTGAGTNGPYDIMPASAGLGIPQADIAIDKIEAERDRWLAGLTFTFEVEESAEGKAFIEGELFKYMNAYPIVDNQGRISIRIYTPPLPTVTIRELNDDNLVGPPTWQGQIMSGHFYNEIDFKYDWDFKTGQFLGRTFYEEATSQSTYNQTKTLTLESKGIRSAVMGQPRIDKIALRIFKRFANPAPTLNAQAFFTERIMETGDVVLLTSESVPNHATGRRGVSGKLVEISKKGFDYARGMNRFEIIDTEFSYGRRYAAISPPTTPPINFPNYLAATDNQRAYAFISTKVNVTTGTMSNGDDGYYITA